MARRTTLAVGVLVTLLATLSSHGEIEGEDAAWQRIHGIMADHFSLHNNCEPMGLVVEVKSGARAAKYTPREQEITEIVETRLRGEGLFSEDGLYSKNGTSVLMLSVSTAGLSFVSLLQYKRDLCFRPPGENCGFASSWDTGMVGIVPRFRSQSHKRRHVTHSIDELLSHFLAEYRRVNAGSCAALNP